MDTDQRTNSHQSNKSELVSDGSKPPEGSLEWDIWELKKQIHDVLKELTPAEQRVKEKTIELKTDQKKSSRRRIEPFVVPDDWEPPKGSLAWEISEFKKQIPGLLLSTEDILDVIREYRRQKESS